MTPPRIPESRSSRGPGAPARHEARYSSVCGARAGRRPFVVIPEVHGIPDGRLDNIPGRLASHLVESESVRSPLTVLLDQYKPQGDAETADLGRARALAETAGDPWRRDLPLHVTASALIVHPPSGRVLLRWHQRQQAWLQVGGHGDPGESDPLAISRREAAEETGLADLVPWPDKRLRHLVIVGVPAGKGERAHEHADLRYFLATQAPEAVRAENEDAPVRWLSLVEAGQATSEANLKETLARLERVLSSADQALRESEVAS